MTSGRAPAVAAGGTDHDDDAVRMGVSGHQVLPEAALNRVVAGLREVITKAGTPVVGVSSLAVGADQLFAREVLAAGGRLHAVVPCQGYDATLGAADWTDYHELLQQAVPVEVLPYAGPSEEAFYAAGRRVVDASQELVAVWDGRPARGLGGTADIVAYARQIGRPVHVIWPDGVDR